MQDEYLSVSQVASLKDVSRAAVYKAIREGRLAATELVGTVAILRQDAQAWEVRSRTGRKIGTPMTQEAKEKLSASQRARWQSRKKQ